MARRSRCAGFDSGRGRFAAPLFLNGFVVLSKDSFPLKRRSCYQARTQHSGYSRDAPETPEGIEISEPNRVVGIAEHGGEHVSTDAGQRGKNGSVGVG